MLRARAERARAIGALVDQLDDAQRAAVHAALGALEVMAAPG